MAGDDLFRQAVANLLGEVFGGSTANEGFILNRNDPGLVAQMESITAEMASTRPMPGQTTIAAHVDHVLYALSLLNRWAAGEANPFAMADWSASWKRTTVNDAAWKDLCRSLRQASANWQKTVATRDDWILLTASGAVGSVAHAAYHLGAIRQILAAMNANTAPK